jgi:hypothetical protein
MLFVRFFLPVVTLLLAHTIRNWFRLRHIPGPLWAKVTDLWRAYHYIKGDYGDVLLTLHKRYGDLVRTGPNSVNLGNPSSVPVLYRTNPTLKKVKGNVPFLPGQPSLSVVLSHSCQQLIHVG